MEGTRARSGLVVLALVVSAAALYALFAKPSATPRPASTTSSNAASTQGSKIQPPTHVPAASVGVIEALADVSPNPATAMSGGPPPAVGQECPAGTSLQQTPSAKGCVRKEDGGVVRLGRWDFVNPLGQTFGGEFVDGKEEGQWSMYFPSGHKAQESWFHQGMLQGWQTLWDEDGHKIVERLYRDNQFDGPVNRFLPDGTTVREVWQAGTLLSTKHIGADGEQLPD